MKKRNKKILLSGVALTSLITSNTHIVKADNTNYELTLRGLRSGDGGLRNHKATYSVLQTHEMKSSGELVELDKAKEVDIGLPGNVLEHLGTPVTATLKEKGTYTLEQKDRGLGYLSENYLNPYAPDEKKSLFIDEGLSRKKPEKNETKIKVTFPLMDEDGKISSEQNIEVATKPERVSADLTFKKYKYDKNVELEELEGESEYLFELEELAKSKGLNVNEFVGASEGIPGVKFELTLVEIPKKIEGNKVVEWEKLSSSQTKSPITGQEVKRTFESDSKGYVNITDLEEGKYVLKEISVPEGSDIVADTRERTFTVTLDETTGTIPYLSEISGFDFDKRNIYSDKDSLGIANYTKPSISKEIKSLSSSTTTPLDSSIIFKEGSINDLGSNDLEDDGFDEDPLEDDDYELPEDTEPPDDDEPVGDDDSGYPYGLNSLEDGESSFNTRSIKSSNSNTSNTLKFRKQVLASPKNRNFLNDKDIYNKDYFNYPEDTIISASLDVETDYAYRLNVKLPDDLKDYKKFVIEDTLDKDLYDIEIITKDAANNISNEKDYFLAYVGELNNVDYSESLPIPLSNVSTSIIDNKLTIDLTSVLDDISSSYAGKTISVDIKAKVKGKAYKKESIDNSFTLDWDNGKGSKDIEVSNNVKVSPRYVSIDFNKVDSESEIVEGAGFAIFDKNNPNSPKNPIEARELLESVDYNVEGLTAYNEITGSYAPIVYSDSNGKVDFGDWQLGDYIIYEVKAPKGYRLTDKTIELDFLSSFIKNEGITDITTTTNSKLLASVRNNLIPNIDRTSKQITTDIEDIVNYKIEGDIIDTGETATKVLAGAGVSLLVAGLIMKKREQEQ